jgi:hypothetical protein
MHLHLTGRHLPPTPQDFTRRLVVGNLLLPTLVGERIARVPPPPPPPATASTERAWLAADDPVPGLVMLTRGARSVAAALSDNWRTWRLRRAPRMNSSIRKYEVLSGFDV